MKPINWGIMGTGWVAQHFMADLRKVAGAKTVAVASRSSTRASDVASLFSVERSYGTYEDLLKDDDVDIVYIATAPHRHTEHCLLALGKGKHVLCEKPFTTSLDDAIKIDAAARESRLFCMEAMWSRFLPGTLEAKRIIDKGDCGIVRMITADFGIPVDETATNRFYDASRGGGALLDRGVYPIALATWFFGKPLRIKAEADIHDLGTDRTMSATLYFADNRIATVSASLGAYTGNRAVIAGNGGRVVLEEPFYRPERLTVSRAPAAATGDEKFDLNPDSPKERIRRFASMARPFLPLDLHRSKVFRFPIDGYGYSYEAAEAVRCIREGLKESPIMPLRDTLLVMEIVDEIKNQLNLAQ